MKVRIEFVPEDSTEERVLKHLADSEGAMEEVSSKLQSTLHHYLQPAFRALQEKDWLSFMFSAGKIFYRFDAFQPKVEVTYVRITEKGDT
jgi:hypothetical protein